MVPQNGYFQHSPKKARETVGLLNGATDSQQMEGWRRKSWFITDDGDASSRCGQCRQAHDGEAEAEGQSPMGMDLPRTCTICPPSDLCDHGVWRSQSLRPSAWQSVPPPWTTTSHSGANTLLCLKTSDVLYNCQLLLVWCSGIRNGVKSGSAADDHGRHSCAENCDFFFFF